MIPEEMIDHMWIVDSEEAEQMLEEKDTGELSWLELEALHKADILSVLWDKRTPNEQNNLITECMNALYDKIHALEVILI
jgi:hypothetical protein